MSLEIMAVLVVGGIAAVAALLQLLGYSTAEPFTVETARRAWTRQEPEIQPLRTHLSRDAMAALIETDRGPGIVWRMGADPAVHKLDGARAVTTRTGLRIVLNDFAAPAVRVSLTPEAAALWRAAIDPARGATKAATAPASEGEPHAA
ncbi:hypothetical protein P6F26_06320 [Roseibacterium sp. SDUM158017]|uniref:hypothetical protein n=1 Tax=Roseicyclus salinarum TaxID=3036773 RepID=UPI0024154DDD|nr:hypothetical protein [Roseibacterium sp. SDUM158017]MDG4648052.1 hypothetical protein [Roseibacterium sp. SDUM158017]